MYESLPLFPVLLPSVPFEERRRLPRESGIYFALTTNGDVLYIGATQDLYHRWKYRTDIEKFQESCCHAIAFYVCDIEFLADAEESMISQFEPPLNKKTNQRYKIGFSASSYLYWLERQKLKEKETPHA